MRHPIRRPGAVLGVLTAINGFNYLDRYVLSAVLPQVQRDLGLDDSRAGLLGSVFIVVYLAASPFAGALGDRVARRWIVAGGVFLWSAATVGTGLAAGYATLLAMRAAIGIGEAGYATVGPTLVADLYRKHERGRKLALFFAAIPVGSALGYLVGGVVGQHFGWRAAFVAAGLPGLALAASALLFPEPERGASDDARRGGGVPAGGAIAGFRRVLATGPWRINTAAMTLGIFSMGGLAFWMPTFLVRTAGLSVGEAGLRFGVLLGVAGLGGTLLGGHLGDRASGRRPEGHFRVSGLAMLCGAPIVATLPWAGPTWLVMALAFAGVFVLSLTMGPLNAALVGSVPAGIRASAVALNVLFIHLLGDALSPWLLGRLSEATSLALALSLAALPVAAGGALLVWASRRR